MDTSRRVAVSLVVVAYLFFGSCKKQDPLIGRWQELGGKKSAEYFSDGTALFNGEEMSVSGTWKRLDDERVKVDLTVLGTSTIEVFQVTSEEDTVTFTNSKGKAERYYRANARKPSNGQDEKVIRSFSGACPGEGGCLFGTWEATDEVTVYSDYSSDAPIHFKLKRGERVEGITSILEVNTLGEIEVEEAAEIREQGIYLSKGEILKTYYYLGEGYMFASARGKDVEVPAAYCCVEKSEPKTTLWLQIRNGAGKIGWTSQHDRLTGTSPHDPSIE